MADEDLTERNAEVFSEPGQLDDWTPLTGLFPTEHLLFDRWLPGGPGRVLDLGCGGGRTTAVLVERGYEVEAVELNAELAAVAARQVPEARVHHADASRLDQPDRSFDAVLFSFNGLDYIYPRARRATTLVGIGRVLRPGGLLIFSTHNVWGQLGRDVRAGRAGWRRVGRHLRQQRPGRDLLAGYWRYPEGPSVLVTHAAGPRRTLRMLADAGFEVVAVLGPDRGKFQSGENVQLTGRPAPPLAPEVSRARLTLSVPHVHVVARRR